ncbi:thymidylate kinase, putative [Pediculus humanus corporis]|uniref:dTMP kinase n=1 Tax=Pediculus humanus subsp. corporis TaxID=121224 RepID=E0VPN9_PEDHC|nr:thymidylate kinase, putative [Pediculus humanus corporis]EEB15345.1 thymidylate kinase, putative [Pediculus humanus corporis]
MTQLDALEKINPNKSTSGKSISNPTYEGKYFPGKPGEFHKSNENTLFSNFKEAEQLLSNENFESQFPYITACKNFNDILSIGTNCDKENFVSSPAFLKFCTELEKNLQKFTNKHYLIILNMLNAFNVPENSKLYVKVLKILGDNFNLLDSLEVLILYKEIGNLNKNKEAQVLKSACLEFMTHCFDSKMSLNVSLNTLISFVVHPIYPDFLKENLVLKALNIYNRWKIIFLYQCTSLLCPDYKGLEKFTDTFINNLTENVFSTVDSYKWMNVVQPSFGGEDYVLKHCITSFQHSISYVIVLDENNRPINLSNYKNLTENRYTFKVEDIKLQPNHKMILILEHKPWLNLHYANVSMITGIGELYFKTLEGFGYNFIYLPSDKIDTIAESEIKPYFESLFEKKFGKLNNTLTNSDNLPGALIVFEGCDRAGKTTQCKKLVEKLNELGIKSQFMQFPEDLNDQTVHLLFSANRWENQPKMVKLLHEEVTLIVDRYSFSGVAYSAAKPGMDFKWCYKPEIGLPKPDLVFLLYVPVNVLKKRIGFGEERYENNDFQQSVFDNYIKMKDDTWHLIDASKNINEIHEDILKQTQRIIHEVKNSEIKKFN